MSDSVPVAHGDVTGEYLALRRGAGIIQGWHELVWVRGPDTIQFLDGLVSQAVAALSPGRVSRSLLLSPRGKLRATTWLLRGVDEVGILTDRGVGASVVEDLSRFKIRVDVEIVGDTSPLVDVWGAAGPAVLEGAGLPAPAPGTWVADPIVANIGFPSSELPRYVVSGHRDELEAAGAVAAGSRAADAVRIEAGEPVMGVEIDEATIPQEAGVVEGAVDFDKGCYLGQELVARIDSRGHVNRALRGLVIRENVLPPVPANIVADGTVVGELGSLSESLELRAPVGMALIRAEVEPGDEVEIQWDGGATFAVVAGLPLLPA